MIADSHCHLDYPHLYNQLDNVIKRADINEIKYINNFYKSKKF